MAETSPQPPGAEPAGGSAAHAAWSGPRLLVVKALVLAVLALTGALLTRIPGVRDALSPAGRFSSALRELGWPAVPMFVLAAALFISIGVPRLLFCPLAGAAFGFWGGLAVSTVATMIAYFASFLFIRGRLADREAPFELPAQLAFLRHDPGVAGVIVTRLIPVPGLIATAALSLSPVRKRAFLLGSLIGLVPEAVPLILLGAGLFEGNPKQLAWMGAGAVLSIVGSVILIRRLSRRYRAAGY